MSYNHLQTWFIRKDINIFFQKKDGTVRKIYESFEDKYQKFMFDMIKRTRIQSYNHLQTYFIYIDMNVFFQKKDVILRKKDFWVMAKKVLDSLNGG